MNRLIWTVLGCLWMAGSGSAPGGGGGEARPTPSPSPPATRRTSQAVAVVVRNFQYMPATVAVAPGTVVTWSFEDAVAHSTNSDPASPAQWDSGLLTRGQTYSRTFGVPGNYPYHCSAHPRMTGEVFVR